MRKYYVYNSSMISMKSRRYVKHVVSCLFLVKHIFMPRSTFRFLYFAIAADERMWEGSYKRNIFDTMQLTGPSAQCIENDRQEDEFRLQL